MDDKPLKGALVVDFSQGIAAPYAGRLLAEHGARVIKVEPPEGDWIRGVGEGPGGNSVNYLYYNLGKESVVLDLKDEVQRDAALALAARADIVLESARPGVMDRLGLGFEAVKARNPDVVYLSVSGFGLTGSRRAEPMTDTVAQAWSGMMSINEGADGVPHKLHTTIIDAITGLYAFQSASLAFLSGRRSVHLDVSLMQAAAAIMGPKVMEYAHFGRTPGALNPPAGAYEAADGWIAITAFRESHFAGVARAVGRPELAEDPRFATFAARRETLAELTEILSAAIRARPTADWLTRFAAEGVLASRINDFGDWLADPHVVAAESAPVVEVAPGLTSPTPRTAGRAAFDAQAPALGVDGDRVLAEFGLSAEGKGET